MSAHRNRGPLFWITAAVGWALILWGIRGALHHHIDTRPAELVRFLLGGALIHDLLVAPIVLFVGILVARVVPPLWRGPAQAAALMSACTMLFAYPLVRGYGRALNNPTSLPHNYAWNLAFVVAAVWLVTFVVMVPVRRRQLARALKARDGG